MAEKKSRFEEIQVAGDDLLHKVKEILREGNVRRVTLKNEEGTTLLEIPLTAGIGVAAVSVVFAPVLVAVGAIAAVVTKVNIVIERDPEA